MILLCTKEKKMEGEISDWIALTALVTSFVAYLEAKKANKTGDAIEL